MLGEESLSREKEGGTVCSRDWTGRGMFPAFSMALLISPSDFSGVPRGSDHRLVSWGRLVWAALSGEMCNVSGCLVDSP